MASQDPYQQFEGLFAGQEYAGGAQTRTANSSHRRVREPAEHHDLLSLLESVRNSENSRRSLILNNERVEEPTSTNPELEAAEMAVSGIVSVDFMGLEKYIGHSFVEIANIDLVNPPILLETQFRVLPDGSPATFARLPRAFNLSMLAPAVFAAFKIQYLASERQVDTYYRTRLEQLNGPRRLQKLRPIVPNDLGHATNVDFKNATKALRSQLLSEYLGILRHAQLTFVTSIVCQHCQRHHYNHNTLQQWELLKNAWTVSNADVGDDFGAVEVYANPVMVAKCNRDLEDLMEDYLSAVSGSKCRPADAGMGYYLL